MMYKRSTWIVIAICLLGVSINSQAQVRLLGITGLQGEDDQETFPDNTLFEISTEDAETTKLMELTFIPDTHAIGFNPDDGLLYHTAGSESWTDDPGRIGGFRDHQYLETVNLETGELTPIFNANPPPSPDDFPSFGLAAPLPSFIMPQRVRLEDDPECEDELVPGICPRERGENEYHGIRGLTWSKEEKLFYASDEHGIFKFTPEGESTFVGQPVEDSRNTKGIVLYESEGNTTLLTGTKKNANLWTIDPETGDQIDDPVELLIPEDSDAEIEYGGTLGLAQHPETGVLYGIRKTDPDVGNSFERELVTIDPVTGDTTLVGNLGLHFASLAFVFDTRTPGDFNGDGSLTVEDANLLVWEIAGGMNGPGFDLNGSGAVDREDLRIWVKDLANTYFGDANLDGEFNSKDLIDIFQAGKYEEEVDANWAEGDWTGDHRFNSGDLVAAFEDGGYELGPPLAEVPEPSSIILIALGLACCLYRRRDRS